MPRILVCPASMAVACYLLYTGRLLVDWGPTYVARRGPTGQQDLTAPRAPRARKETMRPAGFLIASAGPPAKCALNRYPPFRLTYRSAPTPCSRLSAHEEFS